MEKISVAAIAAVVCLASVAEAKQKPARAVPSTAAQLPTTIVVGEEQYTLDRVTTIVVTGQPAPSPQATPAPQPTSPPSCAAPCEEDARFLRVWNVQAGFSYTGVKHGPNLVGGEAAVTADFGGTRLGDTVSLHLETGIGGSSGKPNGLLHLPQFAGVQWSGEAVSLVAGLRYRAVLDLSRGQDRLHYLGPEVQVRWRDIAFAAVSAGNAWHKEKAGPRFSAAGAPPPVQGDGRLVVKTDWAWTVAFGFYF